MATTEPDYTDSGRFVGNDDEAAGFIKANKKPTYTPEDVRGAILAAIVSVGADATPDADGMPDAASKEKMARLGQALEEPQFSKIVEALNNGEDISDLIPMD